MFDNLIVHKMDFMIKMLEQFHVQPLMSTLFW